VIVIVTRRLDLVAEYAERASAVKTRWVAERERASIVVANEGGP
jgi:hypothetical protein